ncbi:hypothetical protein BGZ98_003269 [Dissophora globulifera]|nr:hypothetical protein BGZ98_003269 [Dissophora globulifera]
MKFTAIVSMAIAAVALTDAAPINRRPSPSTTGHSVSLTRNDNYQHNTHAQIVKLNRRYPSLRVLATATSGNVSLTNVKPDIEYFGTVLVGTPPQKVKLDFDTGSSDIWFPSKACTSAACKNHVQFDSTKSTTFQKDGRPWSIAYGDGSTASGILGTDVVNVESAAFGQSPSDGLFGLGFNTIESVAGVKTFMDKAIAGGVLAQPVISVFLPSVRRNGGVGGEYLFGAIDNTKFTGNLTYAPVTRKGYWQIAITDVGFNNQSLGQASEGIIDTGTTLVIVGDAAAAAIHSNIQGAVNDPQNGWLVPCSAQNSIDNVSFAMGGGNFNIPVADLAFEDLGDGSGNCFSGVQGGQNDLWILGDVFIKNNYCVFDQGKSQVGIAPLNY